jgi:hypothetical protein
MGAAGSVDGITSSLTKDSYDKAELKEIFQDQFDEVMFNKHATEGIILKEHIIHVCNNNQHNL